MACLLVLRHRRAHIHDTGPIPTPKEGDLLQADLWELPEVSPLKHIMLCPSQSHFLQDPAWYRPKLTSRAYSLGLCGYANLACA